MSTGANLSSSAISTGQTLKSMKNIKVQILCKLYANVAGLYSKKLSICFRISLISDQQTFTLNCLWNIFYLPNFSKRKCPHMPAHKLLLWLWMIWLSFWTSIGLNTVKTFTDFYVVNVLWCLCFMFLYFLLKNTKVTNIGIIVIFSLQRFALVAKQ